MPFGVEIEGGIEEIFLYAGAALICAGMVVIYFFSGVETFVILALIFMFMGIISVVAAVVGFVGSQGTEGRWT